MMSSVKNKINKLLSEKIEKDFSDDKDFIDALHLLLNGNFIKYNFNNTEISLLNIKDDDFQSVMFKLNEKVINKRKMGYIIRLMMLVSI